MMVSRETIIKILALVCIILLPELPYGDTVLSDDENSSQIYAPAMTEKIFELGSIPGRQLHGLICSLFRFSTKEESEEQLNAMIEFFEEKLSNNYVDRKGFVLVFDKITSKWHIHEFCTNLIRLFVQNRVKEATEHDQIPYHCTLPEKIDGKRSKYGRNLAHSSNVNRGLFSPLHCAKHLFVALRNLSAIVDIFHRDLIGRDNEEKCSTLIVLGNFERLMEVMNRIKSDHFWQKFSSGMRRLTEIGSRTVTGNFGNFIYYYTKEAVRLPEFNRWFMRLERLVDSEIWSNAGIERIAELGEKAIQMFSAMLSLNENQFEQAFQHIKCLFTNSHDHNKIMMEKLVKYLDAVGEVLNDGTHNIGSGPPYNIVKVSKYCKNALFMDLK